MVHFLSLEQPSPKKQKRKPAASEVTHRRKVLGWSQARNTRPTTILPTAPLSAGPINVSPVQLVVRGRVLGGDVREVTKDLFAVHSQRREQDQLLPGGAEQAGIVLDGEFAEERQLLDPSNLPEKQFIRQTTQQRKQLCLSHFVPAGTVNTKA